MGVTKIKAKTQKQPSAKPANKISKHKAKKSERNVKKAPNKVISLISKNKLIRYFIDSWKELKLVHWPNRKANWSLTGAVILFTSFFVILVIFLDYIFQLLFKLIMR